MGCNKKKSQIHRHSWCKLTGAVVQLLAVIELATIFNSCLFFYLIIRSMCQIKMMTRQNCFATSSAWAQPKNTRQRHDPTPSAKILCQNFERRRQIYEIKLFCCTFGLLLCGDSKKSTVGCALLQNLKSVPALQQTKMTIENNQKF